MGLLAWFRRTLLYLQLKLHYTPRNLLIRLYVRSRLKEWALPRISYLTITGPGGRGRLGIYLHSPPPSTAEATDPSDPQGTADTNGTDTNKASKVKGPKPVHINIHGGGFTFPLHGIDSRFCHLLSTQLGCYVVDADYRMAPDHPFPAAYEDVKRVVQWVRANEGGLFDTTRISIGGFSAGANLSLAVVGSDAPEDRGKGEEVKGVVAFYPATDFTIPYSEKKPPSVLHLEGRDKGVVLTVEEGSRFRSAYLLSLPSTPTYAQLADPRLSPRFAPPSAFPDKGRTMVLSCEYDYLNSEAEAFAQSLEEGGTEPVRVRVEGMGHGWDGMTGEGTEGARKRDEEWARAVEVLRRAQAA